eukprot:287268_1
MLVLVVTQLLMCVLGQDVVINTQLGRIRGIEHKSVGKQTVYTFFGISYAVQPVGALRFRQAQLNTSKWNGVYNATKYGDVCMQRNPHNGQSMSENCLFLNIYTQNPNASANLPVFFWIHGGGWTAGASSDNSYNALNLVGKGKDFVYVSVNYRLGAFGFLSNTQLYNEDKNWKSYGGLNGLYDQIVGLKWVKKYISDYGGDPNSVTIFGESAGGLSVCNLLVSPLASGLFHRGIVESGACNGPWGMDNTTIGVELCDELLRDIGYPPDNLTYLRSIPGDQFQNATSELLWAIAVDGMVLQQLPKNIFNNLNQNSFNAEKVIIGFNTMDSIIAWPYHAGRAPRNDAEYKRFIDKFISNKTQQNLLYEYYYPPSDFPFYPPDHNSYEIGWFTMISDCCLKCPSLRLGKIIDEQKGNNVVYMYMFGGPGRNGSYYAGHGSEIGFIYDEPISAPIFDLTWSEVLSNEMLSSWTNFAKFGEPNITDTSDNINFEWVNFGGQSADVMIFQDTLEIKKSFDIYYRNNVCDFWYNQVPFDEMKTVCLDGYSGDLTTTLPPLF